MFHASCKQHVPRDLIGIRKSSVVAARAAEELPQRRTTVRVLIVINEVQVRFYDRFPNNGVQGVGDDIIALVRIFYSL